MSSPVAKIAAKSVKLFIVIFISLWGLIWLLSPFISQHYATKYLNEHQLILGKETTIRYNPFWSKLTIDKLEVTAKNAANKPVVAIKSLSVTLSLYRLLTDTLHFSEFDIDGLILDINLDNETPIIGGFAIVNSVEDSSYEEDSVASNSYRLSIPLFTLKNAVVNLAIEQSQQEVIITSLALKNVLASNNAQQVDAFLQVLINQAPVNLTLNAQLNNNQGEIHSRLTVNQLDLAPLQPFLSANIDTKDPLTMQGLISIDSKQFISISDKATKINFQSFELNSENLKVTQKNKSILFNISPFALQNTSIELTDEQAPKIIGKAKLNINNIIAYENNDTQLLAKISAVNIDEIALSTPQSFITAHIANVIIEQAVFAENTADELPPLAIFKNLTIAFAPYIPFD